MHFFSSDVHTMFTVDVKLHKSSPGENLVFSSVCVHVYTRRRRGVRGGRGGKAERERCGRAPTGMIVFLVHKETETAAVRMKETEDKRERERERERERKRRNKR